MIPALLLVAVASVSMLIGSLWTAHHHRIGPFGDDCYVPRDPDARRAARGDQPARGVWL